MWKSLVIAALFAAGPAVAAGTGLPPARTHDGGVCAGLSWIRLVPGEKAFMQDGPDFFVLRFEGPTRARGRSWGVYVGNYAQVHGNGPLLLEKDGVTVRRAMADAKFQGYLAEKQGSQNHFFGSVFSGTDADRRFFDRIDFGKIGQKHCAGGS